MGRRPSPAVRNTSAPTTAQMTRPRKAVLVIGSFSGDAVDLDLHVVVHVVRRVAGAVEAHVAGLDPLGVEQPSLIGLDVFLVLAGAEAGGVVVVVVEDRRDTADEVLVVGNLDDDVPVDPGLAVIVPGDDGAQDLGLA